MQFATGDGTMDVIATVMHVSVRHELHTVVAMAGMAAMFYSQFS